MLHVFVLIKQSVAVTQLARQTRDWLEVQISMKCRGIAEEAFKTYLRTCDDHHTMAGIEEIKQKKKKNNQPTTVAGDGVGWTLNEYENELPEK